MPKLKKKKCVLKVHEELYPHCKSQYTYIEKYCKDIKQIKVTVCLTSV